MSWLGIRISDTGLGVLSLLILGAGFVAMFAGVPFFFVIWVLGFAVLLPIVAILFGDDETESEGHVERIGANGDDDSATFDSSSESVPDALATLRDRYARGDLTDEQFEGKLDRLLETESPEAAAEWRTSQRGHERSSDRGSERLREGEREPP